MPTETIPKSQINLYMITYDSIDDYDVVLTGFINVDSPNIEEHIKKVFGGFDCKFILLLQNTRFVLYYRQIDNDIIIEAFNSIVELYKMTKCVLTCSYDYFKHHDDPRDPEELIQENRYYTIGNNYSHLKDFKYMVRINTVYDKKLLDNLEKIGFQNQDCTLNKYYTLAGHETEYYDTALCSLYFMNKMDIFPLISLKPTLKIWELLYLSFDGKLPIQYIV